MILQLENEVKGFKEGEYILFKTGENSVNVFPTKLRLGKVIKTAMLEVLDITTNKVWKPYTNDCISLEGGINIKSVRAVLEISEFGF